MRVREGQGVVLLCGPPPHSGGKVAHSEASYRVKICNRYITQSVICAAVQQILSISEALLSVSQRNLLIVWYHFSDSSSTLWLSGQSGSHVGAQISLLFVCVVEVSGVSHFYFGTLWPVSLIFNGGEKKLWHADWRGCLWLGPCQAE